ncbi:MAG: PKD domain-containing protein [Bacteroidota bacterium]
MKKVLFTLLLVCTLTNVMARHIKGGFFTYKYLGPGITNPTNLRYQLTLTVFMECYPSEGQLNNQINFTIFNSRTNVQVANPSVSLTDSYELIKTKNEPCINGTTSGCYYTIVVYELQSYELPASPDGYTISYQRCCRIEDMDNIVNSGDVGNTYTIQIPGTNSPVANANKNNSPDFLINDTIVVCQNSFFSYPFKATDEDGDSLTYALCSAFLGGGPPPNGDAEPNPAAQPPYSSVPYKSPYMSASPMGSKVTIDPASGLISGIAPPIVFTGEYVITVCVSEYRNGVYFAESRKELHIRVRDCDPVKAYLNPIPVTCDGFSVSFSNDVPTASGTDHIWNFGDPASGANNISTSSKPTHVYTDTGVYTVKLKISIGGLCTDSTTTKVKVYPGFFPGFKASPTCVGQPVQFTDTTKTNYGTVTGWRWDFADLTRTNDTSHLQNPTYIYNQPGTYSNLQFVVGNTFGCIDTVTSSITVFDKPSIQLMNDTIICSIDTLQLTSTGNGSYSWSPNYMISNLNSPTPLVSPDVPTKYFATLTDLNSCKNTDSIFVDVRSFITVNAGPDTTICKGDPIILHPQSEGLQYTWSPAGTLNDPSLKNPIATPLASITYQVVANLGKCADNDFVNVKVVPYPLQQPNRDTGICFSFSAKIYTTGGSTYRWSPVTFLSNPNISNPDVLAPTQTTQYIATVTDTLGCPKPTFDTFTVRVILPVNADAGPRDTAIVIGEPLHLRGNGAEIYTWSPSTWLDDPNTQNPIANPQSNIEYVLLAKTKEGCKDTDTIAVSVYRVLPDLYVPTAFTPNGDGNNDIFRPIMLGMRRLNYFRVYNRWGQLVFSTNQIGHDHGWDGTINGKLQDPATFIWQSEGVSYEGKTLTKKGYVVLIR